MSMGRAGFKQPGYRSVARVAKPEASGARVVVFGKQVHGEWRIAATEAESEVTFEETPPAECFVESASGETAAPIEFRAWRGEDLTSGAWDVSVVVWQWCRGVPEKHGNLMALGEEWWCPFLAENNLKLEEAFSQHADHVDVTVLDRSLQILFTTGQSFALQKDEARGTERTVRRVIKSVQEVKVMVDRMATPPLDLSDLAEQLPHGEVPHHFFCPITQDVMQDPVKTNDGMVYDRPAIDRWFTQSSTSPLTGLPLTSKALVPHATLREQIQTFFAQHADLRPQGQAQG
jgi:hypothetical protein